MEVYFPGLEYVIEGLYHKLMAIPYCLIVFGVVLQIHRSDGAPKQIFAQIVKTMIIVVVIANARLLFKETERLFLDAANLISPGYKDAPMQAMALINEPILSQGKGLFSVLFGDGAYQSFILALASLVIKVLSFIQIPILLIQYFVVRLGFAIFPILVSLFIFPSQISNASRFVAFILAAMAWPIGFAMTNLVATEILNDFSNGMSGAKFIGSDPDTVLGNLRAGILASLVMLLGTLGTPKLMSIIFSGGLGVSGTMMQSLGMASKAGKFIGGKAAALVNPKLAALSKITGTASGGAGSKFNPGNVGKVGTQPNVPKIKSITSDV